ncbi:hypothetical protein E1264_38270 [Actinomadura sp. KC216]|nr:hypothetical protein E1264_38270 [Actinomadura sp. KC216]
MTADEEEVWIDESAGPLVRPYTVTASGNGDARPPLPRRQAQTHLPPELADAPVFQQDDQDEEVEHNPGLMAAFKKGIRSVQEDDGAADGPDSPS